MHLNLIYFPLTIFSTNFVTTCKSRRSDTECQYDYC